MDHHIKMQNYLNQEALEDRFQLALNNGPDERAENQDLQVQLQNRRIRTMGLVIDSIDGLENSIANLRELVIEINNVYKQVLVLRALNFLLRVISTGVLLFYRRSLQNWIENIISCLTPSAGAGIEGYFLLRNNKVVNRAKETIVQCQGTIDNLLHELREYRNDIHNIEDIAESRCNRYNWNEISSLGNKLILNLVKYINSKNNSQEESNSLESLTNIKRSLDSFIGLSEMLRKALDCISINISSNLAEQLRNCADFVCSEPNLIFKLWNILRDRDVLLRIREYYSDARCETSLEIEREIEELENKRDELRAMNAADFNLLDQQQARQNVNQQRL